VAGMLDRDNLLDIIRTFTLFSTSDKGEIIKIVGRYQQFRAVKLAVKRLLDGKNPRERSGIIRHTQGSGKSLTMMFMVREMYRHPSLSKWKVVLVTDRTQLESQLSETSQKLGDFVADGSLSAAVGHVYPLEQFKEAFEQSLKSNRSGKILFRFGATDGWSGVAPSPTSRRQRKNPGLSHSRRCEKRIGAQNENRSK
jgi:rRNA processing protein Krr1/Pno1